MPLLSNFIVVRKRINMPPCIPSEFPKLRIVKNPNGNPLNNEKIIQVRSNFQQKRYKNLLFIKTRFDFLELEAAFRQYLAVASAFNGTDRRISLVLSFHDYSSGLWIEIGKDMNKPKLARGEDFILQSTHFI